MFSIVGGVVYAYTGNQYMTAPAFGSLTEVYKKVSFSFMVPTIIFLGVLYASVSARFIFFRIFHNSRHKSEHTLIGWATWTGILRECANQPALCPSADRLMSSGHLGHGVYHRRGYSFLLVSYVF